MQLYSDHRQEERNIYLETLNLKVKGYEKTYSENQEKNASLSRRRKKNS